MSSTTVPTTQPRSSSGTSRTPRSTNPDKQISQIERSVTHLLVATKQLLETLTQWSRGQAQEEEVSDVYVRLGYEFNLACRAFNSIGVETSDLGNVPDLLRHILEDTLSQPASTQALDTYLPRIRDIIINLLHGLKRKQSKLRGKSSKDNVAAGRPAGVPERQASMASTGSNETGLTQMLENVSSSTSIVRTDSRQEGLRSPDVESYPPVSFPTGSISRSINNRQSLRREPDRPVIQSEPLSTMSSTTSQSISIVPPLENQQIQQPVMPQSTKSPPPPPPPKQHDALTALQRGGDLERRASRRFSTYQIQKQLGASPNGILTIPPTQHSPIPNRGREARESLTAVRSRQSYQRNKPGSRLADGSPTRSGTVRAPQRISEEREESLTSLKTQDIPKIQPAAEQIQDDSPLMKTPEEYHKPRETKIINAAEPVTAPPLNGLLSSSPDTAAELTETEPSESQPPQPQDPAGQESSSPANVERDARSNVTPPQSQIIEAGSSSPAKELTLFLQYKSKIKKFILTEGSNELTIARLQLAFIEKFAWNTHNNGLDLPEIYIQDPVSGVRHELEDLSDVRDRSVLVLNVEALDEVKKHFDDGLGSLRKLMDGVKSTLDGQNTMMQRFSDRQLQTSKEMARMSAVPSQRPSRTPTLSPAAFPGPIVTVPTNPGASLQEVQDLRRDIAVLRQTYSAMSSDFFGAMNDIKARAAHVKTAATEAATPSYKGDAGRAHINSGKKALSQDSEALVNRVDDLSDLVEELRKDVVTRGVRPLPRQLEDISKEISTTAKELSRVKDFMKREKPVWTKIWEQELQTVMSEREDLTQQDELVADLDGDLEDVTNVFKLVEEAMRQQNLQNNSATPMRTSSRSIAFDSGADPHEAKTGVLDEVRALQPNHETRIEAIERAEKARQRELSTRKQGEFQREVEQFVEEGKLKRTGGADEIERQRRIKDEQARKQTWEDTQARKAELERKRAAKAAQQVQTKANAADANEQQSQQYISPTQTANDGGREREKDSSYESGKSVYHEVTEHRSSSNSNIAEGQHTSPTLTKTTSHASDGPPKLPDLNLD